MTTRPTDSSPASRLDTEPASEPATAQRATTRRTLLAAGAVALLPIGRAIAQAYPDHAIKVTVGFPPGTGPDIVARLVGGQLGTNLKQTAVIDNRAGAGGQIAAQTVAKSAPDGYTLLLAEVGSISIAPAAFSKLPYVPSKELTVVAEVARVDFLLIVPATSPARTVAEFVQAAKAKADRVNFGTFGAGTPGHFGAEMFAAQSGFKIEPIHFRATGDALTAIIAGDVQGAFVTVALGNAQIRGGKVRALAIAAPQRSPLLPDVPTFAEAAQPLLDLSGWFAFFVPTGTPPAIVETLNRQLNAAVRHPEVQRQLQEAGFRAGGTSQPDADRMVRAEAQRWAGIVKETGFRGD